MKRSLMLTAAVAATLWALALSGSAFAGIDSIADVNATYGYNAPAEIGPCAANGNSNAVVTAVLSQPGVVNGLTYKSWAFYINDGTSGLDVYASAASLSSTGLNYTPTVGDGLDIKGANQPYHSFGELANPTKITVNNTGNAVATPSVFTVGGVLDDMANNSNPLITTVSGTNTYNRMVMPNDLSAQLVTLNNVTLSWGASGSAPTTLGTSNVSGILMDGTSPTTANGITLMNGEVSAFQTGDGITYNPANGGALAFYYWPTSYSVANANLNGTSIDFTGATQYNMTGFLSDYPGLPGGLAEFSPISITPVTAVPEPGTLALLGVGATVAAVSYIRRKRSK